MKVAFLYAGGRESRWPAALRGEVPGDFFYGAVDFVRSGHGVACIDAPENPQGLLARAYNAVLGSRTPVRTRGEHVVAVGAVLERLKSFDVVVATSTSHAIALGLWKRWGRFRGAIVGIHCGLVNYPLAGARLRATSRILREQEVVLFAEAERPETVRRFGLAPESVHANPFGVDTAFWHRTETAGSGLVSVGNDGRRDYATLIEAVSTLDVPLKIVTARPLPSPLPSHVTHIRGSWHAPALTDVELRELYHGAAAVVIPLSDSLQPSGQSVALQAMACGRPVILSRTQGLWTGDDFRDGKEILLAETGSPEALRARIAELLADPAAARRLGRAAHDAVLRHGRIDAFAAKLQEIAAAAAHRH